jgi:hypothetical protein
LPCDHQKDKKAIMKNGKIIRILLYGLVGLSLALTACGRGASQDDGEAVRTNESSGVSGRTQVLREINITPRNPLEIPSGTRLRFTATGSYSDNSVQDVTMLVTWTSSDASIAFISNAPDEKGWALAVSRGYCSISVTFDGISGSTIIGVD